MIKREDLFVIGRLGKPHGINGEMMFNFTDDVFDRVDCNYLFIEMDGLPVPFLIEEYSFYNDETAAIKFTEINSAEAARELNGRDVYFPKALNDEEKEADLSQDVCGFKITNAADGKLIGTITNIDNSTMNVLFNVKTTDGRDLLIPASGDLIMSVSKNEKSLTMKIPEGIMDL